MKSCLGISAKLVLILSLLLTAAGVCAVNVKGAAEVGPKKQQQECGVSGIVFFKTQKLQELKVFYLEKVGCQLWMDQGDCLIFKFGNMLFGFCQRDKADLNAMITFFYERKSEVDRVYKTFKKIAVSPPEQNKKYPIYHFFAHDPEGRMIEFQYFTNTIDWDFGQYR
jgi:predicted lactoylglutathione lyase